MTERTYPGTIAAICREALAGRAERVTLTAGRRWRMSDTIAINVSAQDTPEGFAAAYERFHMEHAAAVERERALSAVYAMANAIAWLAVLGPRLYLGWTRRRWVRARRAWNRERRRFPPRTLVAMHAEIDREMALAILGDLAADAHPVVPDVDAPPRSFAEYVGRRLADGRVPMRGRRS